MSKRNTYPKTAIQDAGIIQKKYSDFSLGAIRDLDARDVPAGGVANLVNMRGYRNRAEGRLGTRLFSSTAIPQTSLLDPSLSWTASKSGTTITASVGSDFLSTYEGYFFRWPDATGAPGNDEYITGITDTTNLDVANSSTVAATAACSIRGPINGTYFDKIHKKVYAHFGTDLWVTNWNIDSWDRVRILGKTELFNSQSQFFTIDRSIYINNANGLFRIANDLAYDELYYFKANDVAPNISDKIIDQGKESFNGSVFRYIYTLSRFKGAMLHGDRTMADDGVVLEQETCPPLETKDEEAYGTVSTRFPMGNYKIILGENIASCETTVGTTVYNHTFHKMWKEWGVGNIGITVRNADGIESTHDVSIDFKRVNSMKNVVKTIERAIQLFIPDMRIRLITNFNNTGISRRRAQFMYYSTNPDDDIVGFTPLSYRDVGTVLMKIGIQNTTTTIYNTGTTIGNLVIPYKDYVKKLTGVTQTIQTYNPTHYSVYRTKDLKVALDDQPDITDVRIVNNPGLYIWLADIPVCKPFQGKINSAGILSVDAYGATLNDFDIGCKAQFNNQNIIIKEKAVDPNTYSVVLDDGSNVNLPTSTGSTSSYGAIGAKYTMLASKSGTTATFAFAGYTSIFNVGELIFWQDGSTSVIKTVTNTTTVETIDSDNKSSQAAAIHPIKRQMHDTITDTTLRARAKSWPLRTRFYTRMPESNLAAVAPGFLFIAPREFNELYYCSTNNPYDIGYYHGFGQFNNKIKEAIKDICTVKDQLVVRTAQKTYRLNPAQAYPAGDSRFGESYLTMRDPKPVSLNIGVPNNTCYDSVEDGTQICYTGEPAIRFFDGNQYSENIALNRIQVSDIQKLNPTVYMDYDHVAGIHLWGKQGANISNI